jgi:hypothetical protein
MSRFTLLKSGQGYQLVFVNHTMQGKAGKIEWKRTPERERRKRISNHRLKFGVVTKQLPVAGAVRDPKKQACHEQFDERLERKVKANAA